MTMQPNTDLSGLPPMVPLAELDPSQVDATACRALWASVFFQALRQHFEAGCTDDGRPYDSWVASRDFVSIAVALGLDAGRVRAWVAAEWTRPHPGRSLGFRGNPRPRDNQRREKS